MAEPSKAVFLSYAREDSPAVQRIVDALRAFGIEVWFDQADLGGGDAWDQKIRTQIRDCALFMPVISATTQARGEGYFRREWRLGSERTHDIASGLPFVVPVVIDDTREADALVPEEFMRVQWSRLPGGAPTPVFIGQVQRMLEAPRRAGSGSRPAVTTPTAPTVPAVSAATVPMTPTAKPAGTSKLPWVIAALAVIAVGYFALRPTTHSPDAPAPTPARETAADKTAKPAKIEAAPVDAKSIAVLPFENMSEEKDANAFFADGVHEDLLTNLSLIRDLHVVSRTSVMQYRNTTKSIRQIAQELGVAYILEGSVRRAGNKVRVTGQLIKAATDEHVWAEAYDRDLTDVFGIQAELSKAIAHALAAALSPAEKQLIERRPTDNPTAYDDFLKAHQMTSSSVTEGTYDAQIVALLTEAVRLDPNFAQAWGELARHHAIIVLNEVDTSPERRAKARAAIETALRLAPDAPEVIEYYGDYLYYAFRDYAGAAAQYQRLAVLRPNDAVVFGSLGLIHRRQGRMKDAWTECHRALELDPHNLRYLRATQQLAQALNRYDEAAMLQEKVVAVEPDNIFEAYQQATIPFLAHGSTRELDALFARLKPTPEQQGDYVNARKLRAGLVGDWADYIAQDKIMRHQKESLFPPATEDLFAALAFFLNGDKETARRRAQESADACVAELKTNQSAGIWSTLGAAYTILGRTDEARSASRKAMEFVPESVDVVLGTQFSANYAGALAWTGDKDGALAELARLLHTPFGLNIYSARNDPLWYPLHGDPRFEALVHDEKNNAPLLEP
ncbi:MAG TPA: TIR domain-containing protein [Candidatus Didemnitutus sp.]|nr:TIR domain-containing protein [Candidatus Didemnitutus sp.]